MPDLPPGGRLTFEIDGPRITASRFRASFNSFLTIANEVADQVAGKPHAMEWLVSVEAGSLRVHMTPEPQKLELERVPVAIDAVRRGMRKLESGEDVWPDYFTEKALEAAKTMAEVLTKSQNELTKVQVRYNGHPEVLSGRSIATVDSLLQGKYVDFGSLEGNVRVLSSRGEVKFSIDEALTGRAINCYFPREMWSRVRAAFDPFVEKRICVWGDILYRRDGRPVNITVKDFRMLRSLEEVPSVEEMIGILK